jgi:hypothetical protein
MNIFSFDIIVISRYIFMYRLTIKHDKLFSYLSNSIFIVLVNVEVLSV